MKFLASALAVMIINLGCFTVAGAQQKPSKEERRISKMKKLLAAQNRYAPKDPVTIKLKEGAKIKGYIAEVYDDHFVVSDLKSGQPTSVDYSRVKDLKSGFIGSKPEPRLIQIIGGMLAMLRSAPC